MKAKFGCVVLTQGKRPEQLTMAINSVLGQIGVEIDLVVVGNGFDPKSEVSTKTVFLPENIGIPAGRNAGVSAVVGDYLFFLDDDVFLPDEDFLIRAAKTFEKNNKIGLIQPQPQDPQGLPTPRRWIPRVWVRDPDRSSKAFSLWEGATLIRREVFEAVKGWPDDFFYGHEGVALVWRVWNWGKTCEYQADLVVAHPMVDPSSRHADFYFYNARNRQWLAKRFLPFGVKQIYLFNWFWLTRLRLGGNKPAWQAWLSGWREGKTDLNKETLKFITLMRILRWGRFLVI